MDKYLSVEAVGMSFGASEILTGIDLSIRKGEFVTLIGHSGCGKSTLLNLVAGLMKPTLGAILLAGKHVDGPGPDRGVVFQNHSLLPWLTCYENVHLAVERVFNARALAIEPKVLLLDEPFGALDALTRATLQDELMRIVGQTGDTVLMVTHDVDEAVLLSDRVVMMSNGPSARIGEVLDVKLPRPRQRLRLPPDPPLLDLRA